MIDKVREIALKSLYKIDEEKAYSNIVLNEMINSNKKELTNKDIGLISEIVYGTITWKLTIDEIIKKYSNIRLKKISVWILNILRMGVYQIVFLDKIPKSAAVNESVNLAKRYGHKASSNFVNAVLRKVSKEDYLELFNIEDNVERLSKVYSIPVWIVEQLLMAMDFKDVEKILKNSNLRPEISIRVNNLKITKNELIEKLEGKGITVRNGLLEDFLIVEKVKNIENMEEFKNGLFTVQDEVAGLIPLVLNPSSSDYILDACSSPGGKTTYLAELMNNEGKIDAFDLYEHRVKLVENNVKRLGIKNINLYVNDASIYNEEYKEKFDKILLDVPCLGLGVLKRKPDIKWQKEKEDILKINEIQLKILENCSKYLKVGGILIYSTCSILKNENEYLINKFLEKNNEFDLEKIDLNSDKIIDKDFFEKYQKNNKYIQVYQNEKTDGFFIAKIVKKC